MVSHLSMIGFGEAGSGFASAAEWGPSARAFDLRPVDYSIAGVVGCRSLLEATVDAHVLISIVTAEAALGVARDTAQYITPGAFYFDMNSVAPDTKRAAAVMIEAAGGRYVDVAIMAAAYPQLMAVPLLLSGPHTPAGAEVLAELGFRTIRVVEGDVGRASSIKMIRSVMVKGVEALTGEMMAAAQAAGVVDEILASLGEGWPEKAAYNLERMATHGVRRAAEMEESAKTLVALGVDPVMTRGTIIRQREMAA